MHIELANLGDLGALTQIKISPLGGAFTTPRGNLGFLGPPHTSGSNYDRKLKFWAW